MYLKKATLAEAMANLERALTAGTRNRPEVWAGQIDQALASVEQAVQRRDALVESPDEGIIDVDSGQAPSPGLDRSLDRLREDLADLLTEARMLRRRVRQILDGSTHEALGSDSFAGLRCHAAALLDNLALYEQQEAHVILETATTDIGAGD
jgi:hypothetical protein